MCNFKSWKIIWEIKKKHHLASIIVVVETYESQVLKNMMFVEIHMVI